MTPDLDTTEYEALPWERVVLYFLVVVLLPFGILIAAVIWANDRGSRGSDTSTSS